MTESIDNHLSTLAEYRTPATKLQRIHWIWAGLAAFVSGGILSTCYWPLNFHFLVWIALVPWLIVLPKISAKKSLLFGTILGLVYYRIGFDWLFTLYGPIGGMVVVTLAILMGLSFYVANRIVQRFGLVSMLWALPLTFVGQEILRSEGLALYRFSFLVLGYSQSQFLWLAQIASLGGVYFLSFLIVFVNVSIAYALLRKNTGSFIPFATAIIAIPLLALLSQPPSYGSLPRTAAACAQVESYKFDDFIRMTEKAIRSPEKPRFIVLPEHTIEPYARENHPLIESLEKIALENQVYICLGADMEAPQHSKCDFDNCSLVLGPDGKIQLRQLKAVPVPFMADGNPADSHEVLETPFGRIAAYVCYDGTFTDIPRELIGKQKAQLLLGPVLDVERWPEQERHQHAEMASLRSIELRRCNVRAAGSGISQIIDARGVVLAERSRQEGPGFITGLIYFPTDKTIFVRYGHYFATYVGYAFILIIVILLLTDLFNTLSYGIQRIQLFRSRYL